MWRKRPEIAVVALALLVTACNGADEGSSEATLGPGAASATEAVDLLVEYLNDAEFTAAADLAIPDQAALASLAEAATFAEVADALRSGDVGVVANFWAGFAQGSGSFLAGPVESSPAGVVSEGGLEFSTVSVTQDGGDTRNLYLRDVDGFRVDLFASFGAGLAGRMTQPVERLLTAQSEDASLILSELRNIVPSLLVAASQPDLPAGSIQELIQLVELITRVG